MQVKAASSVSHDTPPNVWWCGYACHMIGDAVYPDASPTTPYSPYFADASTKLDRLIIGNARIKTVGKSQSCMVSLALS